MPSKSERKRMAARAAKLKAAGMDPPPRRRKGNAMTQTETASEPARPKGIGPTPERLAKPDRPEKGETGVYRTPAPIERLHARHSLDHQDHMNDLMYDQALELQRDHYQSGLSGLSAQDLNHVVGGSGDAAYMMPKSEGPRRHRQQLIRKLNAMGWFAAQPLRGAGRVTFAVVCLEMGLADAGRLHCGIKETERAAAVAKDRLREGLMALVDLAKIRRRDTVNAVLGHENSLQLDRGP
jgi:hypothetical protein